MTPEDFFWWVVGVVFGIGVVIACFAVIIFAWNCALDAYNDIHNN